MKTGRGFLVPFLLAIAGPGVATAVGLGVGSARTAAAALIYLLGVVVVAAAGGYLSGIVASILSFLGLNLFFTPPRGTLRVGKTDDLVALVVFVSVGLAVSALVVRNLTLRMRAERRELESRSLYAISSRLLGGDLDDALHELASTMCTLFDLARCEVRARDESGDLSVRASAGEGGEGSGRQVDVPLSSADPRLGLLVLVPGARALGEPERRVASVFARQIGSALERLSLEREAREARVAAEANRARGAILSAVSHDFRTPLSSIKTAITALLPDARGEQEELLSTALEETQRLERLVSNLLDLTRLRSGAFAPSRVRVPVEDLLDDALAAARAALGKHTVDVRVRPDLPSLDVDPVQVGQALGNVLENAAKYSPPGAEIKISASLWRDAVEIRVADRGPGIPEAEREAVFEEFHRADGGRVAGTGLGLAIAKALVVANDGRIWVEETPGGGATVTLRLPAGVAA